MRRYKLTEQQRNTLIAEAITKANKGVSYINIDLSKALTLPTPKEKAKVVFSAQAYKKMESLVKYCTKEIAWHGVVERIDAGNYRVTDILVYPQTITAVTVESDDALYPNWLDTLDDGQFNNLRLQGHSHVNMPCSPSSTDTHFYEELIEHIKNFYIFIIMNKANTVYANIYDVEAGVVWEDKDVQVMYETEGIDWQDWYLTDAAPMLAEPKRALLPEKKWGAASQAEVPSKSGINTQGFDDEEDLFSYYAKGYRGGY